MGFQAAVSPERRPGPGRQRAGRRIGSAVINGRITRGIQGATADWQVMSQTLSLKEP